MKPFYLKLLCGVLLLSIISCSKNNDTDPTPTTPNPTEPTMPTSTLKDTLSAGWTKMIIAGKQFTDIFFGNNSKGFLSATGSLFTSSDGGLHWDSISSKLGFTNITCTPNGEFVGAANNLKLYKSSDGKSLTEIPTGASGYLDVWAVDNDTVYAVTRDGSLWGRYNSTLAFTLISKVPFEQTEFPSLYFLNSKTGWIANNGNAYLTEDKGMIWTKATINSSGIPGRGYTSVSAPTSNSVFIGTQNGVIYKSSDGGKVFTDIKRFRTGNSYLDLHFIDDNLGYCCYGNRIYKTVDGGKTWQQVVVTKEELVEIHFTDANHGWACGYNGLILKYNQ